MATTTLDPTAESAVFPDLPTTDFVVPTGTTKAGQVRFLDPGPRPCLAIQGSAAPGSEDFQACLQVLYSVAYGVHFGLRRTGIGARIGTLEGLWEQGSDTSPDANEWRWTLLIEIPAAAGDTEVAEARTAARAKHPALPYDRMRLIMFDEGRVIEALHVGPYASEPETIARMTEAATARGLRLREGHHEIYLSDPGRVAPERLRTILRKAVA